MRSAMLKNKYTQIVTHFPLAAPALTILLLTFLLYIPALQAPPHWDDIGYLVTNYHIRTWSGLWRIWFTDPSPLQYYPVVFTSYWIEYHIWGMTIWAYHLVNILLHGGNAILLMMVLRKLRIPGAFFIALLFACHPIHVETVVMIAERKNLLAFLFFMLAALAYLKFTDIPRPHRYWHYAAAILCFILAIQSKTVVFVFPFVMLIVQFYRNGKLSRRDILSVIPFLILAIPQSLIVRHIEHYGVGANGPDFEYSIPDKILIAGRALWFYIAKLIFPYPLMPIYVRWHIDPRQLWQYLFPASYLAVFTLAFAFRKKITNNPWLLLLTFFVISGPALGFVTYYPMVYSFVSDHYIYLGSVPILIALVLLATLLRGKIKCPRMMAILSISLVFVILSTMAMNQSSLWRSKLAIWAYNYKYNPHNHGVLGNLAVAFMENHKYEHAKPLLYEAAKTNDHRYTQYDNLGTISHIEGHYDEAFEYFRMAATQAPGLIGASMNYGIQLQAKGRYEDAIVAYGNVIKSNSDLAEPFARIAYCQWAIGNHDLALKAAQWALERDPNDLRYQKVLKLIETTPAPATRPAPSSQAPPLWFMPQN